MEQNKVGAIADGMAEDLIRAITQAVCAEGHYKTLIEKYNAELNNGLIEVDDVKGTLDKMNDAIDELEKVSEVRRTMMVYLMETYSGNKDYHCLVKHLSSAQYNAFEAYQATGDSALLNMALELNARFTKAITQWLGTEISDCAACLSDILKNKSKGV